MPELQEVATLQAKLTPSKQEQDRLEQIQNEVLVHIKTKYPGYLHHFKNVMTSGNHFAINAELEKSREIIGNALGDILGIDFGQTASKREELLRLLGDKTATLKDLYRQFKIGDIDEAGFKAAATKTLAEKQGDIARLFPNAAVDVSSVASTNSGYCATVTVAVNITIGVNVAVGVNIAVGLNVVAGINAYITTNIHFWNGDSNNAESISAQSLTGQQMVNAIAERLR
jgi:hypothetical protein